MPFEPRLVESEGAPLDEQGEILLPVELAELAQRLTSESACLSRQFVDRRPTISPLATRPVAAVEPGWARRVWRGPLAIAALLLLAPLAGWMTYFCWRSLPLGPTVETNGLAENRGFVGEESGADRTPVAKDPVAKNPVAKNPVAKNPVAADPVGTDQIVGAKEAASREPPPLSSPVSRDPDRYLRELTGPELEGVLDLLEAETSSANRLSI